MSGKASIILISYNRPDLIKRSILSVISQTYSNWELLVADWSQPSQKTLIKEYCLSFKNENIKFLSYPSQTVEEINSVCLYARYINEAFKESTGDYIFYLVDDDEYLPEHLESSVRLFEAFPYVNVTYCSHTIIYVNTGEWCIRRANLIRRCGFFNIDHNTVAHRRAIFDEVGGWDTDFQIRQYGDAVFMERIAKAGYVFYPTRALTVNKYITGKNYTFDGVGQQ